MDKEYEESSRRFEEIHKRLLMLRKLKRLTQEPKVEAELKKIENSKEEGRKRKVEKPPSGGTGSNFSKTMIMMLVVGLVAGLVAVIQRPKPDNQELPSGWICLWLQIEYYKSYKIRRGRWRKSILGQRATGKIAEGTNTLSSEVLINMGCQGTR